MAAPLFALPIGYPLGGYEITRIIGAGGFGITYEAFNRVTERRVGIKEFFPTGLATRDGQSNVLYSQIDDGTITWALEKFRTTTTALCRLDHPNILKVLDYIPGNNTGYMVMELLEGHTLEGWLAAHPALPRPSELRPILEPILDALSYVHGQGLIHRDIAPDNVFICRDGRPVLIDFGALSHDVTKATRAMGTVGIAKAHYTAPDQATRNATPDATTDVYSVGGLLYRALMGRPPEDGPFRVAEMGLGGTDPYEPMAAHRPASVTPAMAEAVDAALKMRKGERPESVAALQARLDWRDADAPQDAWATAGAATIAVATPAWALEPAHSSGSIAPAQPPPLYQPVVSGEAYAPGSYGAPPPLNPDPQAAHAAAGTHAGQAVPVKKHSGAAFAAMLALPVLAAAGFAGYFVTRNGAGDPSASTVATQTGGAGRSSSATEPVPEPRVPQPLLSEPRADPASAQQASPEPAETRLSSLATPVPGGPSAAEIAGCDRLTAHENDPDRPAAIPIVEPLKLDSPAAIAACRPLAEAHPDAVPARTLFGVGTAYEYARAFGEAKTWFERAAARGSAAAMVHLADLHYDGRGVPRDVAEARRWYEAARPVLERGVAAGNGTAMYLLGLLTYHGRGVTKDATEARRLVERAAALGHVTAMTDLGNLHSLGAGVPRSYQEAKRWYERAASAGDARALNELGSLYANGNGVPRSDAEARRWFEKAAAFGNADAMASLAVLAEKGTGDAATVRRWYQDARRAYEKEATILGSANAMISIGNFYYAGKGVNKNVTEARRWYEMAAALDNPAAMVGLGTFYHQGDGVTQDYVRARSWWEKAAALGNADAMVQLGNLHAAGEGVTQDDAAARRWYAKAAALGNAVAMDALGDLYLSGRGVTANVSEARSWYEQAAALGNAESMTSLAAIFLNGRGTPVDYAQAVSWYRKAAAVGNSVAMDMLGNIYRNGIALPQDHAAARSWYGQAIALNNKDSMSNLALMYFQGLGGPRDLEGARRLYERAAALGQATAMASLGNIYRSGAGVPVDYAQARDWYEKGAERGNASAMTGLGILYESGNGVARDRAQARRWYAKAVANGSKEADERLARLGR